MASATFPVRLLSGEICHFAPDMSVSEIRAQLNQKCSAIHETRLYLGDAELGKDLTCSISEASTVPGSEVLAVTGVSLDKAIAAFIDPAALATANVEQMRPVVKALEENKDDLSKCHYKETKKCCILTCGTFGEGSQLTDMDDARLFGRKADDAIQLGARSIEIVLHLWAKFGDAYDLAYLKEMKDYFATLQISPGHDTEIFVEAVDKAVRDIEARISKPPAEQPSHEVNGHVQGPPDNGIGRMIADPTQQVSAELEEAIRVSVADAYAKEGADVQEAVLRSTIDTIQQQQLAVLRLTKRNPEVLDALLTDPTLQKIQALVEEAGCEIMPEWAKGAIVLAPLTEQQALEAGVQLCAYHIVVSQKDQAHVEQVLAALPNRRRPVVKLADPEHLNASPGAAAASPSHGPPQPATACHRQTQQRPASASQPQPATASYLPEVDGWDGLSWQVERTFICCPMPGTASERSRSVQSEPWGGADSSDSSRTLKLRCL